MIGRITLVMICQRFAPSVAAASSSSASRSSSTGCTVRTTNGRPMKISAIRMPSGVNATLMPNGTSRPPSQPFSANSVVSAMPATAVGKAKGMSMMASNTRLNGKFVAHQRPHDQRPEHQIDRGSGERKSEADLQGAERAAAGHDRPELIEAQFGGLQEQARQAESAR